MRIRKLISKLWKNLWKSGKTKSKTRVFAEFSRGVNKQLTANDLLKTVEPGKNYFVTAINKDGKTIPSDYKWSDPSDFIPIETTNEMLAISVKHQINQLRVLGLVPEIYLQKGYRRPRWLIDIIEESGIKTRRYNDLIGKEYVVGWEGSVHV